jgi:hypothetical protein
VTTCVANNRPLSDFSNIMSPTWSSARFSHLKRDTLVAGGETCYGDMVPPAQQTQGMKEAPTPPRMPAEGEQGGTGRKRTWPSRGLTVPTSPGRIGRATETSHGQTRRIRTGPGAATLALAAVVIVGNLILDSYENKPQTATDDAPDVPRLGARRIT